MEYNRSVRAGTKTVATAPEYIRSEWDAELNEGVDPARVRLSTSDTSFHWRCELGHGWRTSPRNRCLIKGPGCPYCLDRKAWPGFNDFAFLYPEIAKEWHPTRNEVSPDTIRPGSTLDAWWVCSLGHEWPAPVTQRALLGSGCPFCLGQQAWPGFNDFATLHPELAREWHPTKNATSPHRVRPASNMKYWWLGPCGHEWPASTDSRTRYGTGCIYCHGQVVLSGFNDLQTLHPRIAAEWHPTRNAPHTPEKTYAGSSFMRWWQCRQGHEWDCPVSGRTRDGGSNCPNCSLAGTSKLEALFFEAFRNKGLATQANVRLPVRWRNNRFSRVDFVGADDGRNIVFEYDGSFYHHRKEAVSRDMDKSQALLKAGFLVVRIREGDLGPLDIRDERLVQVAHSADARSGYDFYRPERITATVDTVMAELNRRLVPAAA
ncbi:zinc-ribbon domain-containing protein [Frigoribacterium sp. SL97]|uniref:zinc-ribbon domain-containing protein n=1 Tax=Frigoribacterium sp. SL97 TaxID=2994664 RepID=UPI00226ED10E|nr:zinc-ribbon domain-containing protein [Frigoribacterium sp. SL97]WAC50297.1 zinc-ribbon domain-containing protein [Frigoribacterium sp. SL97]